MGAGCGFVYGHFYLYHCGPELGGVREVTVFVGDEVHIHTVYAVR